MGEVSDGYHTFNQLYHQRAILFATIVNQNKDISWKSYKHSDGKYCFDSNGEWFIVGIDTPEGSYTYHYKKEYWDYFDCKELECGKEWDGHTEEDVTRLLSLKQENIFEQLKAEIDWEKDLLEYTGYKSCYVSLAFDNIKQILEKAIAMIDKERNWVSQAGYNAHNVDIAFDAIKHNLRKSEAKND